jgi:archaellum component FlaF (FlaF/FlaG flagellin family)
MSFYFYKENILFGFKISLILICFISFFIVSFILYKSYFNNFLEFDTAFNNIEDLYYNSFKIFLNFKSELEKFQSNHTYKMTLPSSKDIQMPNFGNILNDLNQKSVYKKENIKLLKQLYNGDLCLLLFYNQTTLDYSNCKSFLSSILLKGMEQAIIRMGVMINSVIDELSVINNIDDFNYTVNGNSTNFKKYETFIEYYLLLSYLKNEEIFNSLRIDETKKVSDISLEIIVIYLLVYFVLFFLLCYFIFMYKYIYNSLFNFVGILAFKFIIDDEYLYHKIIEIENKLYK